MNPLNPFRRPTAVRPARFSTPADAELCRTVAHACSANFAMALGAIVALHRSSLEHDEDDTCHICLERWPCPTVQLALAVNGKSAPT